MSRSANAVRICILALGIGALLGACTHQYFDRRDTIALSAGDAMATNRVTQMVDPWPRASANKNIPFNGEKMQSAVERYRKNQVTPPNASGTSGAYEEAKKDDGPGNSTPIGPTITQPAAPVK